MASLSFRIKKKLGKKLFGFNRARRYVHLTRLVSATAAKKILEIGVFNGRHALEMIQAAQAASPGATIEYFGFDLFEALDEAWRAAEHSKMPLPKAEIEALLVKTGAKIQLFAGDTTRTLPEAASRLPEMDFILIDGGHAPATIESDFRSVLPLMGPKTVVLFDDYWNDDAAGCKTLIDGLDRSAFEVEHLSPIDRFLREWGTQEISMVRVQRRSRA
ncbi:MAG: class I SAM-dependent methyltransferase [Myxococcota bacterium]